MVVPHRLACEQSVNEFNRWKTGAVFHLAGISAQTQFHPAKCTKVHEICRLAATPQIKKNLIEACVQVVGADGLIQEREAELLRAIADTLDCPIPPFVETPEKRVRWEAPSNP